MLHLLVLLLIVLVVFIRISERLIIFEFLLDHTLEATIVGELLLHLEQFVTSFPLVLRLRNFLKSLLVELCLGLLSGKFVQSLLLFELRSLPLVVCLLLDHSKAIRTLFIGWRVVNEIILTLTLRFRLIIELKDLLLFRLGIINVVPMQSQTLQEVLRLEKVRDQVSCHVLLGWVGKFLPVSRL